MFNFPYSIFNLCNCQNRIQFSIFNFCCTKNSALTTPINHTPRCNQSCNVIVVCCHACYSKCMHCTRMHVGIQSCVIIMIEGLYNEHNKLTCMYYMSV